MADLNSSFTALQTDYIAQLNQVVSEGNTAFNARVKTTGLTADFSAGSYKITNLGNAVNPNDAMNLASVQALISGGGTPANIPITSLNKGTASALQLIRINAAGTAVEGFTYNPTNWQKKTTTYTAVAGDQIAADTTSAAFTITLPASPTAGQTRVDFVDYAGTFDINNLTIARNGNPIMGLAEDLTVGIKGVAFGLLFIDATKGWIIV